MAEVKIEIIGHSAEDVSRTLRVLAESIGLKPDTPLPDFVPADKVAVVVDVEPKPKRTRKAKAEEPVEEVGDLPDPEPQPVEEAPQTAPDLKLAALDAIKAVYADKELRQKFKPLLQEFGVQAFGNIADEDGPRFHARVQEIIGEHAA